MSQRTFVRDIEEKKKRKKKRTESVRIEKTKHQTRHVEAIVDVFEETRAHVTRRTLVERGDTFTQTAKRQETQTDTLQYMITL